MKSLILLKSILTDLQSKYHVNIIIKDFYSIIRTKSVFADLIFTFWAHENPYCMHIKSHPDALMECIKAEHTSIGREMNTKPELYENGSVVTCPFGVREFYYPIRCSGYIIGALVVGCAPCQKEEYCNAITFAARYSFPVNQLTEMYEKHIRTCRLPKNEDFWREIAMCGEVLTMACDRFFTDINIECIFRYDFILHHSNLFVEADNELQGKRLVIKDISGENRTMTIIINTITYIQNNYHKKITIKDIAKYCYCSSSTLSHVFAKNYGMTIGKLIHTIRCDRAKVLLMESNMPVNQIALECGFSSSDYFTSVFKSLTGSTPTQYRTEEKNT